MNALILAFAEGAEHGAEAVADPAGLAGTLAAWAWLIPVLPMAVAFAIVLFGKRMPYRGWELATGAMAFVAVYSVALLFAHWAEPMASHSHRTNRRQRRFARLSDVCVPSRLANPIPRIGYTSHPG